jgi:hypothetical protein
MYVSALSRIALLKNRATTIVTLVDMLTDSDISIQEGWHKLGVRATALEGRIWVVFEPPDTGKEAGSQEIGGVEPEIVSAIFGFGPGAMPLARYDSAKFLSVSPPRTHTCD